MFLALSMTPHTTTEPVTGWSHPWERTEFRIKSKEDDETNFVQPSELKVPPSIVDETVR